MENKQREIVIIGGGFAGLAVAKELKGSNAKVTLIDKTNHHLFQPLLYQVAAAALSPGTIAAPIRTILGEDSKINVLLGEVKELLLDQKLVKLVDGRCISFDQLVVAPGAQYNYFGNDSWKEFAPGLKSISDALKLRERILLSLEEAEQIKDPRDRKSFLTYVIIGGGPTGVEMAGAIAEIAGKSIEHGYKHIKRDEIKVYLVEAGAEILNGFEKPLGDNARKMLEKLEVKVLLNTPVTKIERNRVHLKLGSIETPNIIWAAGIKASPLMETLQVEKDKLGRVMVNSDLSLSKYPDVFVLGDAAHFKAGHGKPLPALASVARQQGTFVGKLLLKNSKVGEGPKFTYSDRGKMATIGRAKAVAQIKGLKVSGFFAWFLWSAIHIMLLVGFRNRLHVAIEWMWNYFTFKSGVQLITDRSGCPRCTVAQLPEPNLSKKSM